MLPGIEKVIAHIRSKSKLEWQRFFQDKLLHIREYVRGHGEKSAIFAFVAGVFMVIFFKVTLVLVCLAALAYLLILLISDE